MSYAEMKSQRPCAPQTPAEKFERVEKAKLSVYSFEQCCARRSVKWVQFHQRALSILRTDMNQKRKGKKNTGRWKFRTSPWSVRKKKHAVSTLSAEGSSLSHYICIGIIAIHVWARSRALWVDMTNSVSGRSQGKHSHACEPTRSLAPNYA